jgi:hypothetical protein
LVQKNSSLSFKPCTKEQTEKGEGRGKEREERGEREGGRERERERERDREREQDRNSSEQNFSKLVAHWHQQWSLLKSPRAWTRTADSPDSPSQNFWVGTLAFQF